MSNSGFKVPIGKKTANYFRRKVKHPRVVGVSQEGRNLIGILSCGHQVVLRRIPKWTPCYKCPVEVIEWQEPIEGFREINFQTEKIQ